MRINAIPEWAIGGAALAIGGAALYLYFRGTKGLAKDAVGAAGSAVSGAIEGMGEAFQDVTQATFGVPKTNADQCQADIARGDRWAASFSCPAGTWLNNLFDFGGGSSDVATDAQTAPGGGIWSPSRSTFSGVFTGPNDGSSWETFENPVSNPVPGSVPSGFLPVDWAIDYAPSQPVRISSVSSMPVNEYGATSLFSVAGMRG